MEHKHSRPPPLPDPPIQQSWMALGLWPIHHLVSKRLLGLLAGVAWGRSDRAGRGWQQKGGWGTGGAGGREEWEKSWGRRMRRRRRRREPPPACVS
eukprot:7291929-Pyramimonas_sp.AAC.1